MSEYRITHLAGRARTGSDQAGSLAHAVNPNGRALCGREPGRTSAGWSEYNDQAITCPRCAHLAAQLTEDPARCAYCHNLLEPDEGHKSKYYTGLLCDGCHDLGL
jgi:hypothetical protein